MNWSNNIRFWPRVGKNYQQGFEISGNGMVRLLVVGESHYKDGSHDDNGERTFTQDVVANYLTPKKERGWRPSKFWTVLGRTIAGRDNYIPAKFWNEISYYVFVQDFAGDGPRQRPTPQMWEDSYEPFLEVIEKLAPQKVIVLGSQLSSHVQEAVNIQGNGIGLAANIMGIRHPSSWGFRSDDYYPRVTEFLTT
jgi:hypothetical protein